LVTHSDFFPDNGPVRTCVGCRKRATKRELLRVTAGLEPDDRAVVRPDPEGTSIGRGAYLHPTTECYDLAVRRKAFWRALRWQGQNPGLSSAPLGEYVAARVDR
jgi:predicted RNA-binding protein YlxR (DUF448 family)